MSSQSFYAFTKKTDPNPDPAKKLGSITYRRVTASTGRKTHLIAGTYGPDNKRGSVIVSEADFMKFSGGKFEDVTAVDKPVKEKRPRKSKGTRKSKATTESSDSSTSEPAAVVTPAAAPVAAESAKCTGTTKAGASCQRNPVKGSTVCATHSK